MPRWQAKLSDGRTAILEADEQPSESDVLSALDTQVAEQDLGAGIAESAKLPRRILSTLTSPLAGMASEMGREQGAAERDTRRAGFIGSLGPPAPTGTVGKVMEPFVKIPRADADDPRFQAFLTGALRRPPTPDAASTAAALVNTGAGLVEGVESPAGVATAGAGTLGPAAGKLAALAWGAYMAKQVPEEARRAGEASVTGTPQERKEAYLGLGTTIAMPAMIGAGLVPKESPAKGLARELGRAEPTLPDVESESAKGPVRAEIQPEERRAPPPDMVRRLAAIQQAAPILPKAAAVAAETVKPPADIQAIRPAVKLVPEEAGKPAEVVVGEQGETHPDIIKKEGLKAEDIDKREFVGPQGELSREQVAAMGVPTEFEPGKAHSMELAKVQEAAAEPPKEPTPPTTAGEAPVAKQPSKERMTWEKRLPPVPKGYVRLYRGGPYGKEGLWFSDNPEVAEFHFTNWKGQGPATLSYIDVPEADSISYQEATFSHPDVVSKKTIAEGGDHILPPDLAAQAKWVKGAKPPPTPTPVALRETYHMVTGEGLPGRLRPKQERRSWGTMPAIVELPQATTGSVQPTSQANGQTPVP